MTKASTSSTGRVDAVRDRLGAFWRTNPAAHMAMPALCLIYDVMMVTRLAFVGHAADPAAWESIRQHEWWGLPALIILCLGSVATLLARTWAPFITVCVTSMLHLAGFMLSAHTYLLPPLYVAAYCCVALADAPRACAGILVAATSLLAGTRPAESSVGGMGGVILPTVLPMMLVAAFALWSRGMRVRRETTARVEEARARAVTAAAQRDAMEARARMSAELHDSVGHDLTAIIALAEGLKAVNTDGTMDEAIGMIATLGHQALDDTRKVARSLNPVRSADGGVVSDDAAVDGSGHGPHGWDDAARLLETVRATGVDAVLTETGLRPDDAAQADLCFTVSREAVTNAMRHGGGVSSIVVSWDHRADGSMTAMVRDDGTTTHGDGHDAPPRPHDGTGLTGLRERVAHAGGTFGAGPSADGDGWTVTAELPVMTRTMHDKERER